MGVYVNKPATNLIGWITVIILTGLSAALLIIPVIEKL